MNDRTATDAPVATLGELDTPCLVLDAERMERNIARLRRRLDGCNVSLRPHLKTAKSIEVARCVMTSPAGPATVSTLEEATQFAAAGVRDIIYAVGIAPSKLARVLRLRAEGVDLAVVLDTVEQAKAVARASLETGVRIPALIEIDCDGHRSGVPPADGSRLVEIGRIIERGAELRVVLTHAGGSYSARGVDALRQCAEAERASVVAAANILREADLPCPVVSAGSTPTAHNAANLTGVTEVRAGVFVFFDLVMAGVGICGIEDIALSVLGTVISRPKPGLCVTDSGHKACTQDHGNPGVRDVAGASVLFLSDEHATISIAADSQVKVGDRILLWPSHIDPTINLHDVFYVLDGEAVVDTWPITARGYSEQRRKE